jgi:hypothetical protein
MSWYKCQVTKAGPADDGKVYIGLRDLEGTFDDTWFYAVESKEKEMLATALAAITTGLPVSTSLESAEAYSRINRLYLLTGV